ncbi:hypothetical protein SDRG_13226 [Saprolegnia diclina VS20]|uniref:Uncharacterized protein n=1 Tax=Saprolegnia diclina (strain VS20) TaxID=1156394 RepID=T0Q6I8_SAPDV|nr:hypothetical protein SDRG_13226 [Saprolegnia diclina VS20]EQC29070.1 hypothetical protein SDRG_13226 [Saprolegnia diclina VS20]|eukprot:XP_008617529.1 hypothetical protein SDRG_13226 [Saprolegnia diclina VS20]
MFADVALYARCNSEPLSAIVARKRWRLLGHCCGWVATSRRTWLLPASSLRRTKITLQIVLHRDLQSLTPPQSLASLEDLDKLLNFAADRDAWKDFTLSSVSLAATSVLIGTN